MKLPVIIIIGIVLIAVGLVSLADQGSTYTSRETVLNVGPVGSAQALAIVDRQAVDSTATYREQMKLTQDTLRSFGYAPGATDGIMRFETASALRAFQREQGLKITGQANPETLAALGIEDRLYRRPR